MSKLFACALACLMPIPAAFGLSAQSLVHAGGGVPPGALVQALSTETAEDEAAAEAGAEAARPTEGGESGLPDILRSEGDLPEPVRATHRLLIEAARSGDIEELRVLMEAQPQPPSVSFGDPGDAIVYLKQLSSDADGREILAILLEVLESGSVNVAPGTADELYVWPYFAQYPLESLTPGQLVELFTLVTAADLEDMKSFGGYTFFRVGIAPDGRWLFFLAGD